MHGKTSRVSHDGSGVFVRRADNHLVHFYFNADGEWEQWDVSMQAAAWDTARKPAPALDNPGAIVPPLRKIERRLAARKVGKAAKDETAEFDWKYLMGH